MSQDDVESIICNLQNKIENKKSEDDALINFIANELKNTKIESNDLFISEILDGIGLNYLTKNETIEILKRKLTNTQKNTIIPENSYNELNTNSETSISHSSYLSDFASNNHLKQVINKLEKNKDLTNLMDNVFHFSKRHFNVAKRIFFLQITQNYLSAIKYLTINELVKKQTLFNSATEDALKDIINLINLTRRENEIAITELKNFQKDSLDWFHNDELEIHNIVSRLTDYESNMSQILKNISIIPEIESRLTDYESNKSQILKNISVIQEMESKLSEYKSVKTKVEDYLLKKDDVYHKMEIKINENYNELKEMVISKDLKTTEFLLEKISELENRIVGIKEGKIQNVENRKKQ